MFVHEPVFESDLAWPTLVPELDLTRPGAKLRLQKNWIVFVHGPVFESDLAWPAPVPELDLTRPCTQWRPSTHIVVATCFVHVPVSAPDLS